MPQTRVNSYGRGEDDSAPPTRWRAVGAIVTCALLLAAFALASWTAVLTKSAAIDDPTHAVAGWMQLARGDFRVNPDEPPLLKFAAARAIAGYELPVNKHADLWPRVLDDPAGESPQWCRAVLYDHDGGATAVDALLARSRIVMIGIGVLLGAAVGWWSWKIGGPTAAVVAVALYAVSPTFIGHAALLNGDVAMSLAMLATLYAAWRVGRKASIIRIAILALCAGVTLSLKFSGPLVLFIVALVIAARVFVPAAWPLFGRMWRPWWGRPLVALIVIIVMLGGAIGVLWGTYGFRFRPAPDAGASMNMSGLVEKVGSSEAKNSSRGNKRLAAQPAETQSPFVAIAMFADAKHLLPQAWIYGLLETYRGLLSRPSAFMLDQSRRGGWWYYFPFAMIVKTPMAMLLTAPIVVLALFGALKRARVPSEATMWTATCLALPVVLYLMILFIVPIDFGMGRVLPVCPLLLIIVGVAVSLWAQRSRSAVWVIALLVIGAGAETVLAYPHYVPFFNAGAKALQSGVHLLGESNVDVGQDLPLLAKWQAAHADRKLYVSYYGPADPAIYGIKAINVRKEGLDQRGKWPVEKDAVIAVSAAHLQGFGIEPELRPLYSQLRDRDPLMILGGSIYLYDLSPGK
jgi:hypothetical protein